MPKPSVVIVRGVRYCGICKQRIDGRRADRRHNMEHCRQSQRDPAPGTGQPDIHDVPMSITDGSVGCYIDRGHAARARLSTWRDRSRHAYDFYLTHREGSHVIELGTFVRSGRVVRKA